MFLTARPAALAEAASQLEGIGSALIAQNAAAAAPTTGVVPPAADPVSALTATQFVTHAQSWQGISAMAAEVHQMLVATLGVNSASYLEAEATNAIAASLGA